MNTATTLDEYRPPQSTGAVEFIPDTTTGEEQVDLHLSSLERLTCETIDYAQSRDQASLKSNDKRHLGIGGAVIGATAVPSAEKLQEFYDPTDVRLMGRYTRQVLQWRQMEQGPGAS